MDTEGMKKLANAATPGPWRSNGRYIGNMNHMSCIGEVRDQNGNWSDTARSTGNAAFIAAANPAAILQLIDSHDQLVAALRSLIESDTLDGFNAALKAGRATLAAAGA